MHWALLEISKMKKIALIYVMNQLRWKEEFWDFLYDLLHATTTWEEHVNQFVYQKDELLVPNDKSFFLKDCGPRLCGHLYDLLHDIGAIPAENLDESMSLRGRVLKKLYY